MGWRRDGGPFANKTVHKFYVAVWAAPKMDGHIVCGQIADIKVSTPPAASMENPLYLESKLYLSNSSHEVADCVFQGRMGSMLLIVGEVTKGGLWTAETLVYFLDRTKGGWGEWQPEQLKGASRYEWGGGMRRHLRIGGSIGAEITTCDCSKETYSKS